MKRSDLEKRLKEANQVIANGGKKGKK